MIKKIKELLIKYREIRVYLTVGVLTTVVSWGAYAICKLFMDVETSAFWMQVAVFVRWAVGVLFAYVTNRKFVFLSKNPKILQEFISFTGSRVITLFADMIIMWFLPSILHVNDWAATLISAVVVTVLNYVFSKLMVFRKKKQAGE